MKITTSINSGGDILVHRQCIMDVLHFFLNRHKVSLKNTAFLPSLAEIASAKVLIFVLALALALAVASATKN